MKDPYADDLDPQYQDLGDGYKTRKGPGFTVVSSSNGFAPDAGKPDVVCLDTVAMRSIEWLDRPMWQRSAFHLLAGAKGTGKGTYLALLAAQVTRGALNRPADKCLFVASEDSASIDLVPRLTAAGADLARCFLIRRHVQLPEDVSWLEQTAGGLGGVGLLVVDPVANHVGNRNTNNEGEVRDAIAPLNDLADRLDTTLIGVRHVGKDRTRGALASILGSTGWVDTPRAVIAIAIDDEDPTTRHIQVVAGNRTATRAGHHFQIEPAEVDGLTEPVTRARILGASTKDLDTLMQPAAKESGSSIARDLILDTLETAPNMELESDALDAQIAQAAGIAAKTVRNVRGRLSDEGLIRSRPTPGDGKPEYWTVSRTSAPRP